MDRRIFLRGASALPLTLPASLAFAQTTKVAIGYPTSSDFLPALVAKDQAMRSIIASPSSTAGRW